MYRLMAATCYFENGYSRGPCGPNWEVKSSDINLYISKCLPNHKFYSFGFWRPTSSQAESSKPNCSWKSNKFWIEIKQINKWKMVRARFDWFVSVCGADAWFAVGSIWDETIYYNYTAIKSSINFDRHFSSHLNHHRNLCTSHTFVLVRNRHICDSHQRFFFILTENSTLFSRMDFSLFCK